MQSSENPLTSDHSMTDDIDHDLDNASDWESTNMDTPVQSSEADYQSLREAIENSDTAKIESILDANADLLNVSFDCEITEDSEAATLLVTPLAYAVARRLVDVVKYFLFDRDVVDRPTPTKGWSALHLAIRYDYHDSVGLLLSKNSATDQPDNEGMTPLHLASRYGRVELAGLLLDTGASLDTLDDQECTPFHVACIYGQLKVLELLWEKGSPSQMSVENAYLFKPLGLAVINDRRNIVPWLLKNGASMSHPGGKHGKTALHLACSFGHFEMVQLLLEQHANIHQKDDFSNTPLLQSCWDPQPQIFALLRDEGALVSDVNEHGRNGFHAVVLSDEPFGEAHEEVLGLLIGSGADINHRDIFGFSPLYHACKKEETGLIEILLNLGADINQKTTPHGLTPLMEACCKPSKEPVEVLLREGADTSPVNPHGLTALSLACQHGHLHHVDALMTKGADVAARDRDGHRPLCIAAISGETQAMLKILESPRYYPLYPADPTDPTSRDIFITDEPHTSEIEEPLLHAVENNLYATTTMLHVIMYWAVAHGRINLVKECISRDPEALHWNRKEANWLHVAAQHAQPQLITGLLSSVDASKKAAGRVTALHLAAVSGSLETASCLLEQIGLQSRDLPAKEATATAILQRDSRGKSPLSISIYLKFERITNLFLDEIKEFGTSNKSFGETRPEEAAFILEQLAQYEKPGNESTLKHLLEQWSTVSSSIELARPIELKSPLDWAVYCSQAPAVWWLLSKEGYSSDHAINNARQLVLYSKDAGIAKILDELLQNPLPALSNIANPIDDPLPELPRPTDAKDPALKFRGTIVEMYSDGTIKSTQDPNPTSENIIYGQGPDRIMEDSTDLDQWHLNALKSKIRELQAAPSSTRGSPSAPYSKILPNCHGDDQSTSHRLDRRLQLRWIHLPVNKS
ncbi:unnamed protein product [Clonostachys byssicola]|uniref:Uncharacterized protein n=1 Tax=Clonostachys byssicola TaxID=160290 RepID=A0A9N9Y6P3_9HYPO|nr:unnamed protein product [Clonostachys byssicola]